MKASPTILSIALVAMLAATPAQAQFRNLFQSKQQPTDLEAVEVQGERPAVDQGEAVQAGAQGCAVGGILGGLFGVDSKIGCAVGGVAGYGMNYRRQLRDAREVQEAARAAGMNAEVHTEQVVDNRGRQQEAMSSLFISYEPADMEAQDAGTRNMLDKMAGLTKKSKTPLTIRFEGSTAACHIPQGELTKRGAFDGHTADNQCGQPGAAHAIVITPIPDVR